MTEHVRSKEPVCPTCLNDRHVICNDCGKHWQMCMCVDSMMACEVCQGMFEWTPPHDPDRQEAILDHAAPTGYQEFDFEDELEQLMAEHHDDELDHMLAAAEERVQKRNKKNKGKGKGYSGPSGYSYSKPIERGCTHVMAPVVIAHPTIPNESVTVYATAGRDQRQRTNMPDFGLYLDKIWTPTGRNEFINWPDFKVPAFFEIAAQQITDAFIRACQGEKVEVGCIGAHGRTGTALACMAVLAGYDADSAIKYIRSTYCNKAIETKDQELWVHEFEDHMFGGK